jgi:hypothetical protein
MAHDNYEDWYDNGPGSVAFAREMHKLEISFKQKEFDKRRKLEELRDLVLWLQDLAETINWLGRLGDDVGCLKELHDDAEKELYEWRP